MLPDMLLGIFTGKTQSLGLKENLLPIASIVAGIFVKNPMLKMLLIGLGGANLLNKAGHEALGKERTERNGNVATTDKKVHTLANAVLVQSDRLRQMASQNYDNGQQETIVRTRGIQ